MKCEYVFRYFSTSILQFPIKFNKAHVHVYDRGLKNFKSEKQITTA